MNCWTNSKKGSGKNRSTVYMQLECGTGGSRGFLQKRTYSSHLCGPCQCIRLGVEERPLL
ncbi:hypothetical protein DPMN_129023 [Dreissena polymorpha]|uniref:Uncharacterized protein n=1 Tax=Dreissena polymorpha TaxID=45954 RepID=A0A9D4H0H4_DREPO|nr:hypothetical protein DPMN_129023 [Dreissena polymorpha]